MNPATHPQPLKKGPSPVVQGLMGSIIGTAVLAVMFAATIPETPFSNPLVAIGAIGGILLVAGVGLSWLTPKTPPGPPRAAEPKPFARPSSVRAVFSALIFPFLLVLLFTKHVEGDKELAHLFWIVPAAYYVVVITHELGHAMAGWFVGLRIVSLFIWPVMISFRRSGTRADFAAIPSLAGAAVGVPRDGIAAARWRYLLFIAGGPTATGLVVLLAALLWSASRLTDTWPVESAELLAKLSSWLGLVAVFILVCSLWPFVTSAGFRTDGGLLIQLLLNSPKARRTLAFWSLDGAQRAGVPPREWNSRWLADAMALDDGSWEHCLACLMAYIVAVDKEDNAAAAELLASALNLPSHAPPIAKDSVFSEAAWWHAWQLADLPGAHQYLDALSPEFFGRARPLAAIQYQEGKPVEALATIDAAIVALGKSVNIYDMSVEIDFLQRMRATIEAAKTEGPGGHAPRPPQLTLDP